MSIHTIQRSAGFSWRVLLPKGKMLFVDLEDGCSFAVSPAGTEPKIKFYLFGKAAAGGDHGSKR